MRARRTDLVSKMTTSLTESHRQIPQVCRQFSDATGWTLEFTRVDAVTAEEFESFLEQSTDCCWHTEINDGDERLGYLHITLPEDSAVDRNLVTVCRLAELVAQLINRGCEASRSLSSRMDEVSTLADIGIQLPGFRSMGFFLLDESVGEMQLRAWHCRDASSAPFVRRQLVHGAPDLEALANGRVLLQRGRSQEDARWLPDNSATGLCVPVAFESEPIGTLWAFDRRARMPSERDVHLLESIAAQLTTVLERVVLRKENASQRRLQRDLRVASESQENDILDSLGPNPEFDVAAVCASRYELGGDLCELIRIDESRTVIVVGDASGDSVPAAMVMSAVRGAVRALAEGGAEEAMQTANVIRRLNRTLYSITPAHQFMSLLYGVLDMNDRSFLYTNAGHPTPIHVHSGEVDTLESHGMLLGVLPEADYEHSKLQLSPSDMLILYSDGISEAMDGRRKMFRSDGIISAVQQQLAASAGEVLRQIWSTLELHTNGGEGDDRTLLVIKV